MTATIRSLLTDKSGATAIEYGLIIAVLSLTIVAGVGRVANSLEYLWGNNESELQKAFVQQPE